MSQRKSEDDYQPLINRIRMSDDEYFRQLEVRANEVCSRAFEEGWLSYLPDPVDATPLQKSVNELARSLRQVHDQGDGCLDENDNKDELGK